MKIKSNVQAQKPRTKTKVNKKRLFFIFFTAFVGFFFLCTLLTKLLFPKMNVPALDNENNLSSVTSDDFKGKLDPRLKEIEKDEGPATSPTVNPFDMKQQKENEINVNNINDQGYTEPNVQQTQVEEEKLPYDSRESSASDPVTNDSYDQDQDQDEDMQPQPQPQPLPKKVVKPSPKKNANQQQDNLILRDKLKVQHETPATINKVMVGHYSDLTEAKKVSQELTDSNLNVTPFIRERNGIYSLQVGTFSNSQKAAKLASDLKKRNLDSRVIQD